MGHHDGNGRAVEPTPKHPAVRSVASWAVAGIAVPLMPILLPVWLQRASWKAAVEHGELFLLAVALTGGALAVELLMVKSNRLASDAFRILLALIAMVAIGAAVLSAPAVSGEPITDGDVRRGLHLLIVAASMGLITSLRQGLLRVSPSA